MSSQMFWKPEYWMAVIREEGNGTDPAGWIAVGARKVGSLEINMRSEHFDIYGGLNTWDWDSGYGSACRTYDITTQAQQFTYCKGTSQLAALGALLDTFREEEQKEIAEARDRAEKARILEKQAKKRLKKMKKTGRFDDVNKYSADDYRY